MVTVTHSETQQDEQIIRKTGQAVQDVNSVLVYLFFHVECGLEAPEKEPPKEGLLS